MIVPVCGGCFTEALRAGVEVYHQLKKIISSRELATGLGDEGGFAPDLEHNHDAIELIIQAIIAAGYEPGREVFLAMDAAATSFYDGAQYALESEDRRLTAEELIEQYYEPWVENYPIVSIEDPLAEKDWSGWAEITRALGDKVQIVGDDIFVTQSALLKDGFAHKAANAILIKLNQVGTVTETLDTVALAKEGGYAQVVSHRSGETEDAFISDFVVAVGCGQIKTGAPARGERTAKYNQLLRIEEMLGPKAKFPGIDMYAKYLGR
jgi:enolase